MPLGEVDSVETAKGPTVPARNAGILIDDGYLSAFEILLFHQARLENQFQVGGIHIRVCHDEAVSTLALVSEMSKSCCEAGFASAAFATENNELLQSFIDLFFV